MTNNINNFCINDNNIYDLNYKDFININDNIEEKETNPFTNLTKKDKKLLGKKVPRRKDNIRSIILNHFICYVISFLNDFVKKIYSYQKVYFIKINYEDRIKINIETTKKFMDLTIHEFCQKKVSSKSKIFDENNNFESFQIIKKDLEKINFVNMKLSEFYNKFYLCKDFECLKNDYGIDLNKTKNFYYLLKQKDDNILEKNLFYETGINLIDKYIKAKPRIRKINQNEKKNTISNKIFKIVNSKPNNNIDINNENEFKDINDLNLIKNNQNKNFNMIFNIENINKHDSFLLFDENFNSNYDEFQSIFEYN